MPERKFIFIVDDDEGFVDIIGSFLVRKGYAVEIAKSVDKALEKLPSLEPDACLVDLLLDDGDGLKVVEQIKKIHPAAYIIVLSGHREDEASKQAKEAGADEFVPKPLTTSQLKGILDKIFT
ncbi:MAG: response regulator [Candidatus Omnitrophica bacterium]|nr:response regulator [Candidatus Omnitrophota bacterium]